VVGSDLEVTGSPVADAIVLRLQAGRPDSLEIMVGQTRAPAFRFRRSTFNRIVVHAGGGDDAVRIDEGGGVFTDTETTTLDGGDGRDVLVGGSAVETLVGDAGGDNVDGRGGPDVVFLGAGDDTLTWGPGAGSDRVEGQGGADAVNAAGSVSSELFDVAAIGARVRLFRDADQATLDMAGIVALRLQPGAGADSVTIGTLIGSPLADIDVDLDTGDTGDAGADRIAVGGTAAADAVRIGSTSGTRVDVEGLSATVHVTTTDGVADQLVVNGDAGGDTLTVVPAAAGVIGTVVDGGAGTDLVSSDGTAGADAFTVDAAAAGRARVTDGLGRSFEAAAETTVVLGLGGDDMITVGPGLGPVTTPEANGGEGDDVLDGGDGRDVLVGGTGQDTVQGGPGNDVVLLGAGLDQFTWLPGDGDDIIQGDSGLDTVDVTGTDDSEDADLSSLGGTRVLFLRQLAAGGGSAVLDMGDIETFRFRAQAGSDFIGVGDLSGTTLDNVALDLAADVGGLFGDGANDRLFVQATQFSDNLTVTGSAGNIHVTGLPAVLDVTRAEFPIDEMQLDTMGGTDAVNTAGLAPNTIRLTIL
jgi:Ca2+-binding RTX toxin-like protein